jgi:hypothetical protein
MSFLQILASQPAAFAGTAAALGAAGQAVQSNWSQYQRSADLTGSFVGLAQQAQSGESGVAAQRGLQVLRSIVQAQTTITSGSAQLAAAKARLQAIVLRAQALGFIVTPVGVVQLGPVHWAEIAAAASSVVGSGAAAALKAKYLAQAAALSAEIKSAEAQVAVIDGQQKIALLSIASEIVGAIMPKGSGGASPSTVDYGAGGTPGGGTEVPGYGLAGAGAGGPGGALGGAAPSTLGPGLAGAGQGGGLVLPGNSAPIGRPGPTGGFMGMGGAPVGAAGGAEDQASETRLWMLAEDEDVWGTGDAGPGNGVLA